jgi:hypothetical protein
MSRRRASTRLQRWSALARWYGLERVARWLSWEGWHTAPNVRPRKRPTGGAS